MISTIVPTMGSKDRADQIKRAIHSIRKSSSNHIEIIAVVNGNRYDSDICDWLQVQPDVRYEYCPEPSLPHAIIRGRELVRTPYFSTLDDDDEYLEGGTDIKLEALSNSPTNDLVITNGYTHGLDGDALLYHHIDRIQASPLEQLFSGNWLHNCNALYRSSSVGIDYFKNYHHYAEWTWLAFRLCMDGKKILALDTPTFRYHDTPNSLSKSEAYFATYFSLYRRMLAESPPKEVQKLIRQKMGNAWHDQSAKALVQGRRNQAWGYHLRSLCSPGGFQFLSYSRHLLNFWKN